jgi:hypothetical protein
MSPLSAPKALEQFFLEARCRLLDLAAILDRIGRGDEAANVNVDPRMGRIRQALDVLRDAADGRAERIQKIFSLDYDPDWKKPKPRY